MDFLAQAQAMRPELIERRRDLHRHPEIAFEETRTAGIVAAALAELGLEVQTGIGGTGVVGLLEGARDGSTVLVRADMDALPIAEDTGLPFASETPGKMHACGHDGHVTIALAAAKMLAPLRDQLAGRVFFVFQPAEEIARGAQAMIDDGLLQSIQPDVTVGLHLWNALPFGSVGIADGAVMAGASRFKIEIRGRGGHAGQPHTTIDPVICGAHLITALQSIASRNLDPFESAAISVTMMQAGEAFNVVPQRATIHGTFRVFSLATRDTIERRMREITAGVCAAFGCEHEVDIRHATIPVINNPAVANRLRSAFAPIVGEDKLDTALRLTVSEDVSAFMDDIPGTYFFVGAGEADQGMPYGHHHPRFDFNEDALPLGAALLATAAASYVLPEPRDA